MVVDFRRKVPVYSDVVIKGEIYKYVETHRYLGILIDNKLSWKQNVKYFIKKTHSRLYCLREGGSCGPTRMLILLRTQSLVLGSK